MMPNDILSAFGIAPQPQRPTLGQLVLTPTATPQQAYWASRLANQGTIRAQKPTVSERVEGGLAKSLGAMFGGKYGRHVAKRATAALNDATPLGNVTGIGEGQDMVRSGVSRGDIAKAALGVGMIGLNVMPFAGGLKRKAGRTLSDILGNEEGAIRAWHGSPHDFDRFDMSKIGTGEGAQAYGHGLYFAENKAVANDYRQKLAGYGHTYSIDGQNFGKINDLPTAREAYAKLATDLSPLAAIDKRAPEFFNQFAPVSLGSVVRDIDYTRADDLPTLLREQAVSYRAKAEKMTDPRDKIEWLGKGLLAEDLAQKTTMGKAGRLYEVNINAEPQDFLDWDAPLSGQHGKPADFLRSELNRYLGSSYDRQIGNFSPKEAGDLLQETRGRLHTGPQLTGDARNAGIPGIRYLDQGSRGAGNGTHNYVVFDDKLIDILNKF